MKAKRILALLAALLLAGLYGTSLVFALSGSPHTNELLMASLFASILLPVLVYAFVVASRSVSYTHLDVYKRQIHVDPAVASGPLITTVNDLVAVVSYYGLAWLVLIRMFHMA